MFISRLFAGAKSQKNCIYFKSYKVAGQTLTMPRSEESKPRGAFIVFEGCDRSGKSTQSSRLVEFLKSQNVSVEHMSSPNRASPTGVLINSYLTSKQEMSDEVIHILFTANRWEAQHEMKRKLTAGTTIVMDRYSYSGVAYSAAKGMSFDWCKAPERGLIRPDLVFYLKSCPDTTSKRPEFGEERYEKVEFQKKVADVFEEIYKAERGYWVKIESNQTIENIHQQISSRTMKLIADLKSNVINFLWT